MKRLHSLTAIALTGMVGFTSICAPLAARASEEGKRNTALGLGAAAIALLLTQKNKLPGLVVAGGAAYAYSQADRYRHNRDYNRYGEGDRNRNDNRDNQDRYRQDDRSRNDSGDNGNGYRDSSSQNYGNRDRSSNDSRSNGYHYGENSGQNSGNRGRSNSDSRRTGFQHNG